MIEKETYGFKTNKVPPQFPELKQFEDDLFSLIKEIKFQPIRNKFQHQIKSDIKKITQSKEVFVKADKSDNFYKISKEEYDKLLLENITKDYKKCNETYFNRANNDAKEIAVDLKLDDRINQFIDSNAFLTIKDHKPSFPKKTECRLINPSKSNIGRISKTILEKAIRTVKNKTKLQQWNSTMDVTKWFQCTSTKKNSKKFQVLCCFILPFHNRRSVQQNMEMGFTISHFYRDRPENRKAL